MNKFYLIYPFNEIEEYLFYDTKKMSNLTLVDSNGKKIKNKLLRIIRKVHLSVKVNRIIRLPFRKIWYDFGEIGADTNTQYYCFITGGGLATCNYRIINKMLNKPNIHLLLITVDPFEGTSACPTMFREAIKYLKYEQIYSYSKADSEKYNLKWIGEHIYSNDIVKSFDYIKQYDLYFCGRFKNGRSFIFDVVEYLNKNNINFKCEMLYDKGGLKDSHIKKVLYPDLIDYFTQFKEYSDILLANSHANCILEIVQKAENNSTLRYLEAVVMKKKLLTNNKNVVNLKYYNPKYMKYFEKVEDIDLDWLKSDIDVDYNYEGDFSSAIFFEEEINKINSKEA